eukprot:6206515-Pleurochrysis_carterae.AAC.3
MLSLQFGTPALFRARKTALQCMIRSFDISGGAADRASRSWLYKNFCTFCLDEYRVVSHEGRWDDMASSLGAFETQEAYYFALHILPLVMIRKEYSQTVLHAALLHNVIITNLTISRQYRQLLFVVPCLRSKGIVILFYRKAESQSVVPRWRASSLQSVMLDAQGGVPDISRIWNGIGMASNCQRACKAHARFE